MKLLLITIMLSVSTLLHAQCSGRVDPKNVVMFVDMNNAGLEVAAAQRAACARGQKLLVIPQNHREYNQLTSVVQNDMKAYEHCVGGSGTCERQKATYMASYQRLEAYKNSLPAPSTQIRNELKTLKEQGGKVVNFTISGHDGGGTYSGHKGELDRAGIQEIFADYPEVNGVKSIMLLGCYTAVPNEVMHWKAIFPEAKLIAGYDGIAPASDKIAGHRYLEDLLRKENTILSQASESALNRYLRANIRGLSIMNTGVYAEIECSEDNNKFFYGLDDTSRRMRSMDIKECDDKRDIVAEIQSKISKYYNGELEPPVDSTNGELRRIYNQGRTYEHCGAYLGLEYSMSQAFNLLFYNGIKRNFAKYYADDLARAGQIIGTITPEDVTKPYLDGIAKSEALIAEEESLLALLGNKEAYLAELAKRKTAKEAVVASLERELGDLINSFKKPETIELALKLQKYQELKSQLMMYDGLSEAITSSPDEIAPYHQSMIAFHRQNVDQLRISVAQVNSHPEILQYWVPNAENLSKKSRAETLSNLHRLEGLKNMPGISPRKQMALNWMYSVTEFHLQHMENPFSWHEFTGRTPEKPLGADNLHLDDWLKMAGE
jgi:hypothetical protein